MGRGPGNPGRPKKDVTLKRVIKVRIDDRLKSTIDEIAERTGLPMSKIIRDAIDIYRDRLDEYENFLDGFYDE